MKNDSFNLAFIDLLFNLLVGFVSLFILAFLSINEPTQADKKIDPITEIMIVHSWNKTSAIDSDIWIKGPDNEIIGFSKKEGGYFQLDRDDKGLSDDTYYVDGVKHVVERNIENVTINGIVPGEYLVNLHFYGPNNIPAGTILTPKIEIYDMNPFKLVWEGEISLTYHEENTIVSFVVDKNGSITDFATNIKQKFALLKSPTGSPVGAPSPPSYGNE